MKKITALFLALLMVMSTATTLIGLNIFAEPGNIALNKTVYAPGSGADSITDGNRTTSVFWDGGVAPAEAVIDLGAFYDITKANVVTYFGDGRYYNYTVESSVDGINYTVLGEKTEKTSESEAGTDFTFESTARYFKVSMTKNSANPSVHLVEVEVYGVENTEFVPPEGEKIDPNDPDNIAFAKPTRSNSSGLTAAANDGNTKTVWQGIDYPKYIDVDLLANYDISKIVLYLPTNSTFLFDIYGSSDGVNYTRIHSAKTLEKCPADGFVFEFKEPLDYRIIRVNVTYNSAGQGKRAEISEIKIYGKQNDTAVTPTRETIEFDSYEKWLKDNYGVDVTPLMDANGKYDIDKTYTEKDTVNELNGIVTRLLGEQYISWFEFDVAENPEKTDKDYFKIEDNGGKVKISGTDGTCIAAGLNWYLKYYCNVHIAQQTKNVKMPASIIKVGESVFMDTDLKVRYAYNYCTLSYSMAFFGYDEWRRELDWLMLNGINLVLDITATEALWVNYLQRLGYNADQAKDYVCGYAYKAWWLMGNLENYGGSVSDQWVLDTLEMARVNQRSLTVMGAEPALQTFVGAMPMSFGTLAKNHLTEKGYGDVSKYLAPQGSWSGLVRPNVLRTDYDGYSYLAQLFYESQNYVYGQVTDYYCGDVCHEGGKIPTGLQKEDMAYKILEECLAADKDAVWMLQVWWENPMKGVLDGFGEYRTTNVMLIDLAAANSPKYTDKTTWGSDEYGGTPWIFSTLDNYGGRAGMHGKLKQMCQLIVTAKNTSKFISGMGMTPEGTLQNPIMYDLYWEMVWRDEVPDVNEWTNQYLTRRYGELTDGVEKAWSMLLRTIYSAGSVDGTSINYCFTSLPKFDYTGGYYVQNYTNLFVYNALGDLMSDFDKFADNENYIYDVVDIMRTYLSNVETDLLAKMKTLAKAPISDDAKAQYLAVNEKYMECMLLIDEISSYSEDELVGTWIGRVDVWVNDDKTGKYDDYTIDTMKFNAKCLISAWCSYSLIDYANRQYSGLITDYYYPSWEEFFADINKRVESGKGSNTMALDGKKHYAHAWNFITNGKEYTTVVSNPKGDATSRGLQAIYDIIKNNYRDKNYSALVNFSVDAETGYSIKAGIIDGITAGTSLKSVAVNLNCPDGYTVKAIDENGKEIPENGVLTTGSRVILTDSDGKNYDTLIIGELKTLSEDDKAKINELTSKLEEFVKWAEALDTSALSERLQDKVAQALADAKAATDKTSGKIYGIETLEAYLEAAESAKRSVENVVPDTTAQPETNVPDTTTPVTNGENDGSVVIIIIIAAVVVVAAGVVAFILIKKKK